MRGKWRVSSGGLQQGLKSLIPACHRTLVVGQVQAGRCRQGVLTNGAIQRDDPSDRIRLYGMEWHCVVFSPPLGRGGEEMKHDGRAFCQTKSSLLPPALAGGLPGFSSWSLPAVDPSESLSAGSLPSVERGWRRACRKNFFGVCRCTDSAVMHSAPRGTAMRNPAPHAINPAFPAIIKQVDRNGLLSIMRIAFT